jgi:SAM-dependent methyltransferase
VKQSLAKLLQDPVSGDEVELVPLETTVDRFGAAEITEGVLYAPRSGSAFPIVNGVPVMLPSAFPRPFLEKHRLAIDALTDTVKLTPAAELTNDFSFSTQWGEYFRQQVSRTWGWTVPERIEQLFMEMQVGRDWFHGKTLLDAGCGPGDFTEAIASLGADVVGLDYSSVVYEAERRRRSQTLQFVRGDIASPGLKERSFDAVVSMGVIMFTPDPYKGFSALCRLVKPGGRLYICVDRHPETFFGRYVKYPVLDVALRVISRVPHRPQVMAVTAWANLVYGLHKLVHGGVKVPYNEYLLSAYNDMTPRWRQYHSVYQLAAWFYKNGFTSPVLSHWDNPYAFGLLAIKEQQGATPGIHFGSAPKLWDEHQTVLG